MQVMKEFWIVVGEGVPYVRHPSNDDAFKEADRLAKLNPEKVFVVMRSVCALVVEPTYIDADRLPKGHIRIYKRWGDIDG